MKEAAGGPSSKRGRETQKEKETERSGLDDDCFTDWPARAPTFLPLSALRTGMSEVSLLGRLVLVEEPQYQYQPQPHTHTHGSQLSAAPSPTPTPVSCSMSDEDRSSANAVVWLWVVAESEPLEAGCNLLEQQQPRTTLPASLFAKVGSGGETSSLTAPSVPQNVVCVYMQRLRQRLLRLQCPLRDLISASASGRGLAPGQLLLLRGLRVVQESQVPVRALPEAILRHGCDGDCGASGSCMDSCIDSCNESGSDCPSPAVDVSCEPVRVLECELGAGTVPAYAHATASLSGRRAPGGAGLLVVSGLAALATSPGLFKPSGVAETARRGVDHALVLARIQTKVSPSCTGSGVTSNSKTRTREARAQEAGWLPTEMGDCWVVDSGGALRCCSEGVLNLTSLLAVDPESGRLAGLPESSSHLYCVLLSRKVRSSGAPGGGHLFKLEVIAHVNTGAFNYDT
jgi:hypothetical protein